MRGPVVVVIEVLQKSARGVSPKLRCHCTRCDRVYVTNSWPNAVKKYTSCRGCWPKIVSPLVRAGIRRKETTRAAKP